MSEGKKKMRVLFLCTGNSCRSQIAEGWAKHLKADVIDAYSAGTWPVTLSSRAVTVMAEAGVDISEQMPKHVDDLQGIDFDYVVTLCDNARQQCPVFGGKTRLIHRGFEDPSFMMAGEQDIMTEFRKLREDIRAFVETLPESLKSESD